METVEQRLDEMERKMEVLLQQAEANMRDQNAKRAYLQLLHRVAAARAAHHP